MLINIFFLLFLIDEYIWNEVGQLYLPRINDKFYIIFIYAECEDKLEE